LLIANPEFQKMGVGVRDAKMPFLKMGEGTGVMIKEKGLWSLP